MSSFVHRGACMAMASALRASQMKTPGRSCNRRASSNRVALRLVLDGHAHLREIEYPTHLQLGESRKLVSTNELTD